MKNYILKNNDKLGGFASIEIIDTKLILQTPAILTNQNIGELKQHPFFKPIKIAPIGETIQINCKPKQTPNGLVYNVKARFEVLDDSPEIDDFIGDYTSKKVMLKATRLSGDHYYFGSMLNPLKLSYYIEHFKTLERLSKVVVNVSGSIAQKPVIQKS